MKDHADDTRGKSSQANAFIPYTRASGTEHTTAPLATYPLEQPHDAPYHRHRECYSGRRGRAGRGARHYSPDTHQFVFFRLHIGKNAPYELTFDFAGRLWFTPHKVIHRATSAHSPPSQPGRAA